MEAKSRKNVFSQNLRGNLRSYTMIIALVVIWVVMLIITKGIFIQARNLSMLMRQTSLVAVLSLGMAFVIISRNIDLSVGSLLGLCGGVSACLQVWYSVPTVIALAAAIGTGVVFGLWNGFWVAYRKVPAFIATLGGQMIFQGILLGLTKSVTIAPLNPSFVFIGQGYMPAVLAWALAAISAVVAVVSFWRGRQSKIKYELDAPSKTVTIVKSALMVALIIVFMVIMQSYSGVPIPVILVLLLAVVLYILGTRTKFGRSVYAIGSNKEAAQLAGIKDARILFLMYIMMGALAGLGGIILSARMNAGTASAGANMQLDAIASCVIGGVSMVGGVGNIPGALVGALVMASLDNGMSLMNTEYFWQYIVKGLILIIAVWMDMANKNKSMDH